MTRIGLVACTSLKLDRKASAEELYASPLFTKSRDWVKRNCDCWYILSPKYGLLEPDQEIEPYDATLTEMSVAERKQWGLHVLRDLRQHIKSGDEVIFLAGKKYREYLEKPLSDEGCVVNVPLEGLRIGEQLQWLSRN
jgi:hypothetical protein